MQRHRPEHAEVKREYDVPDHHRRQPAEAVLARRARTSCGRHGGSPAPTSTAGKLDATLLAIKLQEDAGIDIVTDGEQSRQHFVHGFLEFVDGIDFAKQGRDGHPQRSLQGDGADRDRRAQAQRPRPRGRGALRPRPHARKLKITLPGPMTIIDTIADAHYGDRVKMAFAFADLLNEEARALAADGVDVIQFDEPAFNVYMDEVKRLGHRGAASRHRGARLHDRRPHLLRLRHQGQHRLEGDARRRVAPIRGDLPGAGEQPHRPGVARMPQFQGADGAAGAARRQGRAGRRHRCRERHGRDARGGRRRDRRGAEATSPRSASSPAPIAAWRRCAATSPSPS